MPPLWQKAFSPNCPLAGTMAVVGERARGRGGRSLSGLFFCGGAILFVIVCARVWSGIEGSERSAAPLPAVLLLSRYTVSYSKCTSGDIHHSFEMEPKENPALRTCMFEPAFIPETGDTLFVQNPSPENIVIEYASPSPDGAAEVFRASPGTVGEPSVMWKVQSTIQLPCPDNQILPGTAVLFQHHNSYMHMGHTVSNDLFAVEHLLESFPSTPQPFWHVEVPPPGFSDVCANADPEECQRVREIFLQGTGLRAGKRGACYQRVVGGAGLAGVEAVGNKGPPHFVPRLPLQVRWKWLSNLGIQPDVDLRTAPCKMIVIVKKNPPHHIITNPEEVIDTLQRKFPKCTVMRFDAGGKFHDFCEEAAHMATASLLITSPGGASQSMLLLPPRATVLMPTVCSLPEGHGIELSEKDKERGFRCVRLDGYFQGYYPHIHISYAEVRSLEQLIALRNSSVEYPGLRSYALDLEWLVFEADNALKRAWSHGIIT
uniref:Uncharacterized protein n=1 Tax=Chromera velia CCMP2878 TaxID=1169474 RepID=A0A0G4FR30_9ALVE|eukprot:Cvel_3644.t1-p1 / transcript=Cvel_3644.t1 / gene=Cvel_3644 / organism=Chromera_velia_CCMP2878 / gene_product=hypothetical protein / transcript_product=hypothetical protein / location=Cvel_scaffold150:77793-80181(+) / protein_length=486 / sequence_SO=supercontig / SO=protein_coding / is_pseudo=false